MSFIVACSIKYNLSKLQLALFICLTFVHSVIFPSYHFVFYSGLLIVTVEHISYANFRPF